VPQDLLIISPEKSVLSYRLASVGSRVLAHLVDVVILVMTIFMILTLTGIVVGFGGGNEGILNIVLGVTLGMGPFLYFILFEGLWNGQTLGKKAANIRVRMADGTPITFAAALGRNLIRPADLLPGTYFVGLVCMFVNPRSQRFGDIFSNTIVVHEQPTIPVFTPAPHIVGYHPYENMVGELKEMTIEEYVALKRLCDRFPELPREVQLRMMREVWEPLARKCSVPDIANVHPLLVAEAAVMHFGRTHGLL